MSSDTQTNKQRNSRKKGFKSTTVMKQKKPLLPSYRRPMSRSKLRNISGSRLRNDRLEAERKEEEELEKLVLGDTEGVLDNLDKWQQREMEMDETSTESSDTSEAPVKRKVEIKQKPSSRSSKGHVITEVETHEKQSHNQRKPVWIDDDDYNEEQKNIIVAKRNKKGTLRHDAQLKNHKDFKVELEKRFTEIIGTPSWAKLDNKRPDDDKANDILKRVGNFTSKPDVLLQGIVNIKFCRDLASEREKKGCIHAIEFHPKAQVALMASAKTVNLRQVDGRTNPRIQEVRLKFPISCAHFTRDGERFLVGSKKAPYCYIYDMMAGKLEHIKSNKYAGEFNFEQFYLSPDNQFIVTSGISGYIHFLMTKTSEHMFSYKMNSDLRGAAFNSDSSKMYAHSVDGDVYIWDMRQRKCLHRFYDDGCIHGTSIALASSEQHLATGSDTGVVNIYDTSSIMSSNSPTPQKIFLNLTTAVTSLKFNATSEILAMASAEKKASIKLVHCSSMTVFSNFPNEILNLGEITALDMSMNSGYLAAGIRDGNAKLFRLNHYGNY